MLPRLAFGSILFASVFYWGNDFHGSRIITALVLASAWLAGLAWKRVHWSAGLALFWALLSAARVFGAPVSPYLAGGDFDVIAFDSVTAESFLWIVLAVVPLLLLDRAKMEHAVLEAFSWVCLLDSLYVLAEFALGYETPDRGGFFGNTSMNASMIAVIYPILTRSEARARNAIESVGYLARILAPLAAILVSRSNIALAVLLAELALTWLAPPRSLKRTWVTGVLIGILAVAGRYLMGAKFGQDSGRYELWAVEMGWWRAHANPWIGMGTGTYFFLGQNIQRVSQTRVPYLLWMHNEWLQILFEQGIIGLLLMLSVAVSAISSALDRRRFWLLASLIGYAVMMAGNYPLHLATPGFLGAVLVYFALHNPLPKRPWAARKA
jgi:hypothetical protein